MLEIRIGISVLSCVLKLIGELWWHNAQRYILPLLYSIGVSYLAHCWWLGLTTLPMIAPLDLGYKRYGQNDRVARALWLFVITVTAGLVPTILGYESWWAYVPICVVSGFIGTGVRNINNIIGAPLNGLTISFHIWFIHNLIK